MDMKLNVGNCSEAKKLADEYLIAARHLKSYWNYGNTLHHANITLGRIAIKSGEVEQAKSYLLIADNTSGSFQLNSFGPNMSVAEDLLQHREAEVVASYFELCKFF